LSAEFGVRMLPTLLFNYPSMDAIVGHLCEQLDISSGEGAEAAGRGSELDRGGLVDDALRATGSGSGLEDIAVVGMSCRFPGDINSLERLWEVLSD
jgi:hypothetical protein